jgi:hypothetical protein
VQEVLLWQTATIRMMYRIVAKAIAIKVRPAAASNIGSSLRMSIKAQPHAANMHL